MNCDFCGAPATYWMTDIADEYGEPGATLCSCDECKEELEDITPYYASIFPVMKMRREGASYDVDQQNS